MKNEVNNYASHPNEISDFYNSNYILLFQDEKTTFYKISLDNDFIYILLSLNSQCQTGDFEN